MVITLASRGGPVPEIAYFLSDSYIQKFKEFSDIPTLFHSAESQYAQMVRDVDEQKSGTLNKDGNPHVKKCKDYIFAHLHEKISVPAMAEELQISATYLGFSFQSHLGKQFKQATNMTPRQYRQTYGAENFIGCGKQ